jgi:hypothetical protein
MKTIRTITILLLMVLGAWGFQPTVPGQIHLGWYYSSNNLCIDQTNGHMDWFYVLGTNSMNPGLTNWPVIYGQPWTNIVTTNYDGTNFQFYIPFTVTPVGQYFFTAIASNDVWGASGFSNIASTPYLPSTVLTHIFPN